MREVLNFWVLVALQADTINGGEGLGVKKLWRHFVREGRHVVKTVSGGRVRYVYFSEFQFQQPEKTEEVQEIAASARFSHGDTVKAFPRVLNLSLSLYNYMHTLDA